MQAYDLAKENATCEKDILVFLDFDGVVAFKYNDELEQSEADIMQQMTEPGVDFEALLAMAGACTKRVIPGIKPLLQSIAGDGIPICIVTKQSRKGNDVHDVLEHEQITDVITTVLHQYDVEGGSTVTVGGVSYSPPPGKSVTVNKGNLMRDYIDRMHPDEQPKVVVFVDDIVHHIQDAKATFYTYTEAKAEFRSIFAYPENGAAVGTPWEIDKTFL